MAEPLCVVCRAHPVDAEWRPFCSRRCKLLDLARWADGSYRVPGDSASTLEEGPEEERPDDEKGATPKPDTDTQS